MKRSLLEKLAMEVRRYRDKDFLKATMAVCALAANADDEVSLSERYSIDHALATEPSLQAFDTGAAIRILDEYLFALRREGDAAKDILSNKVRRMAGDPKKSRTLMRLAHRIIAADHEIRDREKQEFTRLCGLLNLEPGRVCPDLDVP